MCHHKWKEILAEDYIGGLIGLKCEKCGKFLSETEHGLSKHVNELEDAVADAGVVFRKMPVEDGFAVVVRGDWHKKLSKVPGSKTQFMPYIDRVMLTIGDTKDSGAIVIPVVKDTEFEVVELDGHNENEWDIEIIFNKKEK